MILVYLRFVCLYLSKINIFITRKFNKYLKSRKYITLIESVVYSDYLFIFILSSVPFVLVNPLGSS